MISSGWKLSQVGSPDLAHQIAFGRPLSTTPTNTQTSAARMSPRRSRFGRLSADVGEGLGFVLGASGSSAILVMKALPRGNRARHSSSGRVHAAGRIPRSKAQDTPSRYTLARRAELP